MAIKVGMVSLGCSKNQVDGEILLSLITQGGYEICADAASCAVVIINTCGFIEDAKQESIETILEFCRLKQNGSIKAVVVTGCLAERYSAELAAEIPEADVILGIGKNSEIVAALEAALAGKKMVETAPKTNLPLEGQRVLANAPYFAYLKVADGCDNRCTYCAIPLIRGEFRSRKIENILAEAKTLVASGVKELNLIAQDTTRYGEDIYGSLMLPQLLTELCKIEGLVWLRVLYAYPRRVTDELLQVMAKEDKIVKYIDIPIQHANGTVLRQMNRSGDAATLKALFAKVRSYMPNAAIRTTVIAGFPGETQPQFEELCQFIKDVKFDRLGAFAYSEEEGTPAIELPNMLDAQTKQDRARIIMDEQMSIAFALGEAQVGRSLDILVEEYDPAQKLYAGRSYMDAPDIDTKVYFTSGTAHKAGDFVMVKIIAQKGYDLQGVHQ